MKEKMAVITTKIKQLFRKSSFTPDIQNPKISSDEVNWGKVYLDKIKFILEQSEKCLVASLESGDTLDRKAFTLLAGSLSFCSVFIAIIITKASDSPFSLPKLMILIMMITGFVGASMYCLRVLEAKVVELIGNNPMEMLKEKYSGHDQKYLLCCHARSYESKIEISVRNNANKAKNLNSAIRLIQSTLVIAIGLLVIISF